MALDRRDPRRLGGERDEAQELPDRDLGAVRRDEVEAQWRWTDAIRAGWAANGTKPKSYAAGTWGPSAAIALTERDGVPWQDD